MKVLIAIPVLLLSMFFFAPPLPEAPTGFDNKSNGLVDDATHSADQKVFEETEQLTDGLGPIYNAQSCRECHQNPVSGAASQVSELRVGHIAPHGHFETPNIPIAHGTEIITGRSLVNDRAICPNSAFPDKEIQERVPDTENDPHVSPFSESIGRRLRRGRCRSNPRRSFEATMQDLSWQNLRPGSLCARRRSTRTDGRRPFRLEGSARQPALLRWRRLPQRNGHHQPPPAR